MAPALSRKCHEMRANGATIGDVLLRMGPGRTNPSPSPKRVQAPNRVQAPKRSRHHVFPAGTNYYLELSPYVALSFSCVGFHRGKSAVKLIARQIQKTRHRPRFSFPRFPHTSFVFRTQEALPMVQITLPDGSQRQYPGPVTVADVAQSIGTGPRPPWAAAWRSTAPSPSWSTPATASSPMRAGHRHRQGRRRPGPDPPFHGAPAGLRGQVAVPGRAGHHRPRDRQRLLLRLLVQAPLHAGRPPPSRRRWPSWPRRTKL